MVYDPAASRACPFWPRHSGNRLSRPAGGRRSIHDRTCERKSGESVTSTAFRHGMPAKASGVTIPVPRWRATSETLRRGRAHLAQLKAEGSADFQTPFRVTEGNRSTNMHGERPFFGELVKMMTAAPVVLQVLEGDDAIQRYRDVMGATNPEKAAAGRIRKDFALSMGENSVHGSDAPATAGVEIAQFFSGNEIVG